MAEITNRPPVPEGRKRFEVRVYSKDGGTRKAIFIDDEMLDYTVDISSFQEAQKMGPQYMAAVQRDIARHFTECVSDMVGRKVTVDDIKKATLDGWI